MRILTNQTIEPVEKNSKLQNWLSCLQLRVVVGIPKLGGFWLDKLEILIENKSGEATQGFYAKSIMTILVLSVNYQMGTRIML